MRPFFQFALIYLFIVTSVGSAQSVDYFESNFPELYAKHQIERAGDRLVEEGRYEEAIAKYREALNPKYIKLEDDKGSAIGRITRVLILIERYDEALYEWQWYINQSAINAARLGEPNNGEAELKAQEIQALKDFKESRNPKVVYDYLELYQQRKSKLLPPSFEWGAGSIEASTILRLYDTIGGYDAGINFIDVSLSYFQKHQKQFGENTKLYAQIKTSTEAAQCAELDKKMRERNPDWRTCNLILEYLLVREAFEAEKKAGGPTCRNKKLAEGEYCIGDATKALIQSNHFTW